MTAEVGIPTIGIGAGPDCDGQILVSYDMLGLFDRFTPPFVKQYARIGEDIVSATTAYRGSPHGRYPLAPAKAVGAATPEMPAALIESIANLRDHLSGAGAPAPRSASCRQWARCTSGMHA